MRDPYAVLGVSKSADADTIRKRYKELARKYHPDLNQQAGAADRFKEINEAHEVLGDAEKRKLWDEFGEVSTKPGFDAGKARAWKNAGGFRGGGFPGGGFGGGGFPGGGFGGFGGGGGGMDMDDLLGAMFGAGGGRRRGPGFQGRRQASKGPDVEVTLKVPLVDLVTGAKQTIQYKRLAEGGQEKVETLKFAIPAGIRDGGTVRLRGKGGAGAPGMQSGDLKLTIEVADHNLLSVKGDHLYLEVPVTVGEAVRGGSIEVPTPDGPVRVKVPKGTTGGQRLRLKGRGLRMKGGERGHLFLTLRPTLPEADLEALGGLADQMESLYTGDIRAGIAL
jgi:curved DNA-binding protein